jgi:hypothetical protein
MLHPAPNSIIFWDVLVLSGYLFLNIVIGWVTIGADRKSVPPPKWVKPLIYLSIPWAISIHTVTAFLYAGLPGRHFWLSAIMAARFLASAFAGGPSLLIILALIVRKTTKFDPGKEPIQALGKIVAYAMFANVFFLGLEFFTAFYSQIPGHMESFVYLYKGLEGHTELVPLMWTSSVLAVVSLGMLLFPRLRGRGALHLALDRQGLRPYHRRVCPEHDESSPAVLADNARVAHRPRGMVCRVFCADHPLQGGGLGQGRNSGGRDRALILSDSSGISPGPVRLNRPFSLSGAKMSCLGIYTRCVETFSERFFPC